MPNVGKFLIGVRPASKMFRASTASGSIFDEILSLRTSVLEEAYYDQVRIDRNNESHSLVNDSNGNSLTINRTNIVFAKAFYESTSHFNFEKTLDEFKAIWKSVNSHLKVTDIRRIGVVVEHRYSGTNNKYTSESLTKLFPALKAQGQVDKFVLRFEDRKPLSNGLMPDVEKSDFINTIIEIYDSQADTEYPAEGAINLNVDAQHYFAPVIGGDVSGEVLKLYNKVLLPASKHWHDFLDKNGVINAK